MTTPAQDRDQMAVLSAPREAAQPPDEHETLGGPNPLRAAAREALRLMENAGHEASPSEWDDDESCCICSEPWPCEVEMARRVLADALELKEDR
jgi:hypothetical protein